MTTMPTIKTIKSDSVIYGVQRTTSNAWIKNTRYSLPSDAFIREPSGSIICDGFAVDDIVDEFGANVVVRVVSKSFVDEYGDAQETYQDYQRKVMVQSFTVYDEEVKEGIFKAGEIAFTFKKEDEGLVSPGNRVKYGLDWYEIRRIERQPLVDVLYYLVVRVQKI